jgi:hypothetical protein
MVTHQGVGRWRNRTGQCVISCKTTGNWEEVASLCTARETRWLVDGMVWDSCLAAVSLV